MEHKIAVPQARASRARSTGFRVGALVVILAAAGAVAYMALRHHGSSTKTTNATAVSVAQLNTLARSVGHPIFWVGTRPGDTYELTRTLSGSIFVRYLPAGVPVGTQNAYLTVATYPFPGAFAAIQKVSQGEDVTTFDAPNAALAEYSDSNPRSVHVAWPGVDYQVEVYSPSAGTARALVRSGKLAAFGNLRSGSAVAAAPKAKAATFADLQSLAASLKHPIYWAGPKGGDTYELTRTSSGNVFVRYLPAGVKVGSSAPYLTVATYPFPGAFGAIKALAKQGGVREVKLAGGGVAVADKNDPKSIHLAFPGSAYQVEVFAPSARDALRVVSSGSVVGIG